MKYIVALFLFISMRLSAQMATVDTNSFGLLNDSAKKITSRWYVGVGGSGKSGSFWMTFYKREINPLRGDFYWGVELGLGFEGSYPVSSSYTGSRFSWWTKEEYYIGTGYISVPLMYQVGAFTFGAMPGVIIRQTGDFWYSDASHQYFHDESKDRHPTFHPEIGARIGFDIGTHHLILQSTTNRYFGAEFSFGF
jgi:hypothetical protein